jgi:ArsR family transcriptional regulator
MMKAMHDLGTAPELSGSEGPAALTDEQFRLISRALADPTRHEILSTIGQCPTATAACSAIRPDLPISAATLSHHMRELELAGLVESRKCGKFVNYTLRRETLQAYIARLKQI